MTRLAVFVASFAYVGYVPIAPGTAGALAALLLFGLVRIPAAPALEAVVLVLVLVGGAWSADRAEGYFGTVDPGQIVIDEVAGMLLTLAFLPATVPVVAGGFLLFRVLDIAKPWPAGRLEEWHGGVGVMADDVMCGIYANAMLRAALWLFAGQAA